MSNIGDEDLVKEVNRVEHERYCPITEDTSLDDEMLCTAVLEIESELN